MAVGKSPESKIKDLENRLMRAQDAIKLNQNRIQQAERGRVYAERALAENQNLLNVLQDIRGAVGNVSPYKARRRTAAGPGKRRCIPSLMLSDLHFGEWVDPHEVEGYNEYTPAVAKKRLKNTTLGMIEMFDLYASGLTADSAVVVLGGDILSGDIHQELSETNALGTSETIVEFTPLLASAIETIADRFGSVYVPCVTGNHDRSPRQKRVPSKRSAKDSLSWIVYCWLSDHFRNDERVKVEVSVATSMTYQLYNTRYLLTHGHEWKGGAGVAGLYPPIARGVLKRSRRQEVIGNPFDHLIMGHFHQYTLGHNFLVNGSMKGYDQYAYQNDFEPEVAQQAFWLTTPEHGFTLAAPIYCD